MEERRRGTGGGAQPGDALRAPARRLGRPPAARRQARRPRARGAAAEAQRRGQVHARRLGLPRRRRRRRGRRGRGRLPRLRGARAGRGGGDRAARRRGAGAVLALDHPGGDLDPLRRLVLPRPRPRPHAAASRTASRPPRRAWFKPAAALEAQERGEIVLAFPTLSQLRSLLAFRTSDEALAAYRDRAGRADPAGRRSATARTTASSCPATPTTRPSAS